MSAAVDPKRREPANESLNVEKQAGRRDLKTVADGRGARGERRQLGLMREGLAAATTELGKK